MQPVFNRADLGDRVLGSFNVNCPFPLIITKVLGGVGCRDILSRCSTKPGKHDGALQCNKTEWVSHYLSSSSRIANKAKGISSVSLFHRRSGVAERSVITRK